MVIDLKKTRDDYRAKRGGFRLIEVPPTQYLMIDGAGDPNTATEFADAVAALYPVAYTLKFAARRDLGVDTVVMPLEGLWHAPDMDVFTVHRDKSAWFWTLMILLPDELHHRFIPDSGLAMRGLHHEIYLSDARRVEPAKRRTILRQPVSRVG